MLNVTSEAVGGGAGVAYGPSNQSRGSIGCNALRGGADLLDLARGPGRLVQAMQIDFLQDGLDLSAAVRSGSRRAGARRAPSARVFPRSQERSQGWQRSGCGLAKLLRGSSRMTHVIENALTMLRAGNGCQ
jgi:3-methyladenine DNA glycosylase Mpg